MIRRLGELSLSSAVPLLALFQGQLSIAVGIGLPEIQAKLAGLANVLLAITVAPPALTATIEAAIAVVAQLQAAVSGPTVTLQASAIVSLIAELNVSLGQLTAAASLTIPTANVSAYVYEGPSADFGAELQSAINGSLPGVPAFTHALILATTDGAAWSSVQLVFKTT